jgi:hypothetical protein
VRDANTGHVRLSTGGGPRIPNPGEIRHECVEPDVDRMLRVARHRYAPRESAARARDAEVVERLLAKDLQDMLMLIWREDDWCVWAGCREVREEVLAEGREPKLVVLLARPFDRGPRLDGHVQLVGLHDLR